MYEGSTARHPRTPSVVCTVNVCSRSRQQQLYDIRMAASAGQHQTGFAFAVHLVDVQAVCWKQLLLDFIRPAITASVEE